MTLLAEPTTNHPASGRAGERRGTTPKVVLSWGLGVDSTAILLRYLLDPTSRDFELEDLAVVVAMVGDEWQRSGDDATTHILPLLAQHNVRLIQVARSAKSTTVTGEGLVVLDDSTTPTTLHLKGAYKLSDEMLEAGTIPQSGGARRCSARAKGEPLDWAIANLTEGNPYRHVIGFETGEPSRAAKDARYNTAVRTGEYPLIQWGWDRAACEAYLLAELGVSIRKSCCYFCPFALGSKAGKARTLAEYAAHPEQAVGALAMEHTALALNPNQGLIAGGRLADAVREAGHTHIVEALADHLDAAEHALYEVRRIVRPRKDDATKMANASRAVRTLATGTRTQLLERLTTGDIPSLHGSGHHGSGHRGSGLGGTLEVGDDGIARLYLARREETLPTYEHFIVAAPAGVLDKENPRFSEWWGAATGVTG